MFETFLSRLGWFVFLLMLQVFVFNHIHLFGYATPLPYIYFLLILPGNTSRWVYVLTGFALGLLTDLFTNTPGMAAAATCLSGLCIPLFLRIFSPTEVDDEVFEPSHRSMEWGPFLRYTITAVLLQCTAFFTIEAFSFSAWQMLLTNIGGSSLLTTLLVIAMELIRIKK